jgi:ubiquitin C-terminal hydrolase
VAPANHSFCTVRFTQSGHLRGDPEWGCTGAGCEAALCAKQRLMVAEIPDATDERRKQSGGSTG